MNHKNPVMMYCQGFNIRKNCDEDLYNVDGHRPKHGEQIEELSFLYGTGQTSYPGFLYFSVST